ncbi:MAG: Holliday junction resolvase RuvX [Bdellovibrionales bacterium]|nr:Holliday junction resolvase RuvX [Bdellovibrionales bacterium]
MNLGKRRYIGLDVGTVRVGVAISRGEYAHPYATYARANKVAERAILALIAEEAIEQLVAGMPLDQDNNRTTACEMVENFCNRLVKRSRITVEYVDEYASSAEARQILEQRGERIEKESGKVDAIAAALILQRFIDKKN